MKVFALGYDGKAMDYQRGL